MRFTKLFAAGLCLSTLVGFSSCNDDDVKIVDNGEPTMDLASTQAWIEGGKDLVVKGVLNDNDGIKYIDIVAPDLLVNKRIDLVDIYGEAPTTYELNYKIVTSYKQIESRDSYPVEITVTDVAGNKTTQNLTARLDGDQTAPVFSAAPTGTVTYLVTYGTPASFNLSFTVSDNNAIDFIVIEMEDATDPDDIVPIPGYPQTINVGKNLYVHDEEITMPDDKERMINVSITAYDIAVSEEAHSRSINAVFRLTQQLPEDQKLWLCDVDNVADLSKDVFGVPMLIDNVGPNKYEARYFNETAGTKVRILGQKGDFSPIVIGPSKEDPSIIDIKPDNVDTFILDKEGVYYLIKLNTETKDYEISTYSIEEAIDPIMHMNYGGNDLNTWNDWGVADPWWQEYYFGPGGGPGDIKVRMEQDPNNPHIYIAENYELEAGEASFIIHNWHSHGWWNYVTWRADNSSDPEKIMYYGFAFTKDYPKGTFENRDTDFIGNTDFFEYKYGDPEKFAYMYNGQNKIDLDKWAGDEGYRKNFVPDNWIKPEIPNTGKYKLIFDVHLERAKLVPQN